MTEENPHEPKLNGIEAAAMIGLVAFFDILDFFATLFDVFLGAGELVKVFINVVASATLSLWVIMKGLGVERTLAGAALEFIPLVNGLPLRTMMVISTVWLDRHPKEAELAEKILPNIKNPKRSLGKKARAAEVAKTTQSA